VLLWTLRVVLVLVLSRRSAVATGGTGHLGPGAVSGASPRHALPKEGGHGSVRSRLPGARRPECRTRSGCADLRNCRSYPRRCCRRCARGTWRICDHLGRSALRIPGIACRTRSAPAGSVTLRDVRRIVRSPVVALEPVVHPARTAACPRLATLGQHRSSTDVPVRPRHGSGRSGARPCPTDTRS